MPSVGDCALFQGEILSNIPFRRVNLEHLANGEHVFDPDDHPYIVVLSQDCDLDLDYKNRFQGDESAPGIQSVLFCAGYTEDEILENTNKSTRKRIENCDHPRFHFIATASVEHDALQEGVPELVFDFKNYHTIWTDELYYLISSGTVKRRSKLVSPYKEHLAQRFFSYLGRVGVPGPYPST